MQSKKKTLLILNSLAAFSLGAVVVPTSILLTSQTNTVSNITSSNQYSWETGGSQDETQAEFQFKTAEELKQQFEKTPFTPKTPNEFTNEDLKLFIKPKTGTASNWNVVKEPVTDQDMIDGNIRFKVYQNIKKADGTYEKKTIQSEQKQDIWESKNATSKAMDPYIIKNEFSLIWASDEELEEFFTTSNITASELTKEIVLNNLVSRDSRLPDTQQITVNFSDVSTDATAYGTRKVEVTFNNTNIVTTATGKAGEQKKYTQIFRGFKTTNGMSNDMQLKFTNENIGDWTITDTTAFGDAIQAGETKVSDLTPSEFVSVIDKQDDASNALLQMLSNGTGIGNKPIATVEYMGKPVSANDFNNTTGLSNTNYNITDVRTIPNDKDGSLDILYKYNSIDIYSTQSTTDSTQTGDVKTETKEVKQSFPAGTFKVNQDADKMLNFSWYSEDALMPLGGSLDMVNSFKKDNANDDEYKRLLSNQFFSGTQDTYDQPRSVTLDFQTGSTMNTDTNQYEPVVTRETSVKVGLTFNSWHGAFYTDADGTIKPGFKTEKVFDLKSYNVDNNNITFRTQQEFITQNATLAYETPSSIIMKIKNGEYKNDIFFTASPDNQYQYEVSYVPNNRDGTISITIVFYSENNGKRKEEGIYYRIFSGMKKTAEDSDILEFSWIPNSSINPELLSIPIDEVTKQDVIDYYLQDIPMFSNKTLNENNVDIKVEGESTLKVDVTIYHFDQSNPGVSVADQKFFTRITGFSKNNYENNANIEPEQDLTALITIPITSLSTTVLMIILIALISKRSKIRKFKDQTKQKPKKPKLGK